MKTTGVFTTHFFPIKFEKYNEPIYLIPFGDVHKSSPMHAKEQWKALLDWARLKPRCYFLGMGDYNDLGSTSERRILNDDTLHESTIKTLEDLYMDQVKLFAKDIEFMRGKLIGMMGGNHYGVFQSGITTDQKLAEAMGCKFLGVNTFIRLSFRYAHGGAVHSVDIFAHHGRGGGRTQGASMNPVHQMMNYADAQIYLMGDNHQKAMAHVSKLKLNRTGDCLKLSHQKILLARTGSFLKAYEENSQSYVVDAGLPPSDLGVVKIELTPIKSAEGGVDDRYIDIHASI